MITVMIQVDGARVRVGEVQKNIPKLKPAPSVDEALDIARDLLTDNSVADKAFERGFRKARPDEEAE